MEDDLYQRVEVEQFTRRRRTIAYSLQVRTLTGGKAYLPRSRCALSAQLAAGESEDTIFRRIESALFLAGGSVSEPDSSGWSRSRRAARSAGKDRSQGPKGRSYANGTR